MLPRVLEPEVMDTPDDASDYDRMDHAAVNRIFVHDFLALRPTPTGPVLDLGTGTAQIPIELCRQVSGFAVTAVDAAHHMLALAAVNVANAKLEGRIHLQIANARQLPFADRSFAATIANSIHHHVPDPAEVFQEIVRVTAVGGTIFVRDLIRPPDEPTLDHLVKTYTVGANDHQRMLFADSLRAALTLDEVREFVGRLGFAPDTVRPTSDRHWTWAVASV